MKRAEKMIRKMIDELTMDRIAPRKAYIKQAIDFMYIQGTFSHRKYEIMNNLLTNKYTEIHDSYVKEIEEICERDYQRFLQKHGIDS